MAQTLDEQVTVVERALGECMIDTALVVVRAWLNELGENNPYEEAFTSIQKRYHEIFTQWLNIDVPSSDEELNKITGETYQMVDAVYADIRLLRGLSPEIHGFNHDSITSVMHYFEHCVRFRPEDLEWYKEVMNDESKASLALAATSALAHNLRTCFSLEAFLTMIECMSVENETVLDQCISNVALLLVQYDIRIDFFPQIQDAVVNVIGENDLSEHVFEVLCALVESSSKNWIEELAKSMFEDNQFPEELKRLMEMSGMGHDSQTFAQLFPSQEHKYITEVIPLIPRTWLYALIIEGYPSREKALAYVMVHAGFRDAMWDYPQIAEKIYLEILREGTDKPMDYINYAHCLLLRGDRMMAFENYKQARLLCKTSKEFFALLRPDRKNLIDHGIPLEHVYVMEDQLINP